MLLETIIFFKKITSLTYNLREDSQIDFSTDNIFSMVAQGGVGGGEGGGRFGMGHYKKFFKIDFFLTRKW